MARFLPVLVVALLAALLVEAYYSVDTREGCPPDGFTAISNQMDLSRLPADGKYAICRTPSQSSDDFHDFEVRGVFKLRNSELRVDGNVRVVAKWPARLDWTDVAAREIEDDSDWIGVLVEGAPGDLQKPGYLKDKKYGDCGSFVRVAAREFEDDSDFDGHFTFRNCTSKTTVKQLSINTDDHDSVEAGLYIEDCYGMIFEDLVVALVNDDDDDADGVVVRKSSAAFIRPFVVDASNAEAFKIFDGSNVTLCNPLIHSSTDEVELGDSDDNDYPNALFVAGPTATSLPGSVVYQGAGGLVATLKKCPQKLAPHYPPSMWTSFSTP